MILLKRTKLSLVQFLELLEVRQISTIFEKCDIRSVSAKENVKSIILGADNDKINEVVKEEIVKKKTALKKLVNMAGVFNERWNDLEKCLLLNGYKIDTNNNLIQIEPQLDGVVAFEDELTSELDKSILSAQTKQNIKNLIENSANAFKQNKCNDCLTNARMALETLVRKITSEKFNENKDWQGAVETLRNEEFLTEKERWLIKNTYSFISEACHNFFTDEEYARYGRNLAMSMCYYVIKKYNQPNSSGE